MVDFTSEPIWVWYFLFWKIVIDSIYLIGIGLCRLSIFSFVSLVDYICKGICTFYLGYKICGHRVVYNICLFFNVHGIIVNVPSFITATNILYLRYFFFLAWLETSILLILSNNQLVVLSIFSIDFHFLMVLISALLSIIFFFLLILNLICSYSF